MSTIRSNEDPTLRFAKLFAHLYYHMCSELCNRLGEEEGKKAIAHAVEEFGKIRIRGMHEEAAERGIAVDSNESYQQLRDMPNIGWLGSWKGGIHCVEYCPFADVWAAYGEKGTEYGALYCDIDYQIFNSFGVQLTRNHTLTVTGDYCEFITTDKKEATEN